MTMYLLLFRQGQAAVSAILSAVGGMYEDNLYLSTLYEYLDTPVAARSGTAARGPDPGDGVRFEHVSFTLPGRRDARARGHQPAPAARQLARAGRRERLGQDHADQAADAPVPARPRPHPARRPATSREWDEAALRARIGVIFQDFARYQLLVGENVGAGDERAFRGRGSAGATAAGEGPRGRIHRAAAARGTRRSSASGSRTGASSRAASGRRSRCRAPSCAPTPTCWCWTSRPRRWMRAPRPRCSSISASSRTSRITILISHRFSTVRMADQIAVLDRGRIIERGSHAGADGSAAGIMPSCSACRRGATR